MNDKNAKFEYEGLKTAGVTDYTNQTPPKHFRRKNCLRLNSSQKLENISNMHEIGGAHLQCMNNHYTKFEYKGMKTVGVTYYTNQTPLLHFGWKKCLSSTHLKMREYLSNVHKIEGAHLCERSFGPQIEITCFRGFANNTGADQPAHRICAVCSGLCYSLFGK